MAEYATLAELKAARHITDTTHDSALESALTRASRAIDSKTGRDPDGFTLAASASARVFNPCGRLVDDLLLVDEIGDTTGLVVEVGSDDDGWDATTDYETSPDNAIARGRPVTGLRHKTSWPLASTTRVRVTAKWGWPAVPDEIAQATLLMANRLYMRKDSPEGVAGSNEFGLVRLSRWDPDVLAMIGPYMLPGFG